MTLALETQSRRRPPSVAWQRWRSGLFGSPVNVLITLCFLGFAGLVIWPLLRWALVEATFIGTRQTCNAHGGACWAFIVEKARFILFGLYPWELQGQATLSVLVIVALVVVTAMPRFWSGRLLWIWLGALALSLSLMSGLITGHPVSTDKWGGLPLTVLLSVIGFAGAFPIGIGLALGRRSSMGIVKAISVIFIELLRGVPLIAVLYVSTLLFPLMLPAGATIDKLLRAQIAIILFVAAYMAEIVRAGLQAIPNGQYDAARALGLSWWAMIRLVVLPQALRHVIPAFVNLGIGIFLDTTLVIVIGLLDFLNTAKTAARDPNWLGFYSEAYVFAALIYFAISYAGSRYSLWLEARLRVGRM
jgi:general L-amino acid transport system permease protein